MKFKKLVILLFISIVLCTNTSASEQTNLGSRLEYYQYPFTVSNYQFKTQNQTLEMAYMDVKPEHPNGEVVLLLHGKNFTSAYWEETAKALASNGYRVVMPDQIGFGKSTKPAHYQYSFQGLATNTLGLMDKLNLNKVHVLGHSMGGMLATRFVLMFPERSQSLVLENPIGLEDWKTKVPYIGIDQWYQAELKKTAEGIKQYQLNSYYDGQWKTAYEPWVNTLAGMTKSKNYPIVAWNQALTYDMVFTQPVVYEFANIRVPTLLIVGQRDRTALGKDTVSKAVAKTLGDYPVLGKKAANAIPNAKLVEIAGIGHLPHIEAFDLFIQPLIDFLETE